MIPAPPVLMPPQGWTARFFNADVPGDPFEVVGPYGINQSLHSTLGHEEQLNYGVIPSQWYQRIVRTRTGHLAWQTEDRFDKRMDFCRFALIKKSLQVDEAVTGEISCLSRRTEAGCQAITGRHFGILVSRVSNDKCVVTERLRNAARFPILLTGREVGFRSTGHVQLAV